MTKAKVSESTLTFNFDSRAYESASESPTYYKALKRTPRKEHPFWTYDDMFRQPGLVQEALETAPEIAKRMAAQIHARNVKRILFTGIGASYHLGASAAHVIWRLTGIPSYWMESSKLPEPSSGEDPEGTIVVGLSASGNTIEVVEQVRAARDAGFYTLAFVNLDNTRLTDAADDYYVAPGGFGLVWDFTTRLAAIYILAIELGLILGRPTQSLADVQSSLEGIPEQMRQVLETMDARYQAIGAAIQPQRAAVIATIGNQLPTAWEMALRFEEMAHFPARGRSFVDFLHGGVGYIASDIVTVILAPDEEDYEYAVRAAHVTREVKSPSVVVVDDNDERLASVADWVVRIPTTLPVLKPILYVLPAQIIPYYTEVARAGGNPDAQRTDQPRYARAFDVAYPPKSH